MGQRACAAASASWSSRRKGRRNVCAASCNDAASRLEIGRRQSLGQPPGRFFRAPHQRHDLRRRGGRGKSDPGDDHGLVAAHWVTVSAGRKPCRLPMASNRSTDEPGQRAAEFFPARRTRPPRFRSPPHSPPCGPPTARHARRCRSRPADARRRPETPHRAPAGRRSESGARPSTTCSPGTPSSAALRAMRAARAASRSIP